MFLYGTEFLDRKHSGVSSSSFLVGSSESPSVAAAASRAATPPRAFSVSSFCPSSSSSSSPSSSVSSLSLFLVPVLLSPSLLVLSCCYGFPVCVLFSVISFCFPVSVPLCCLTSSCSLLLLSGSFCWYCCCTCLCCCCCCWHCLFSSGLLSLRFLSCCTRCLPGVPSVSLQLP